MLILTLIKNKMMPDKREKPGNGMTGKIKTKKELETEIKDVDHSIYCFFNLSFFIKIRK